MVLVTQVVFPLGAQGTREQSEGQSGKDLKQTQTFSVRSRTLYRGPLSVAALALCYKPFQPSSPTVTSHSQVVAPSR